MKLAISPKKRFIVAAFVALIFIVAISLGGYAIRQNYEAHHYVTLTMEDDKGRITHVKVSQQRLEQINRGANKMYKDITEQVDRERKQKGLPPIQSQ
jgi:hypothetical protein